MSLISQTDIDYFCDTVNIIATLKKMGEADVCYLKDIVKHTWTTGEIKDEFCGYIENVKGLVKEGDIKPMRCRQCQGEWLTMGLLDLCEQCR